MPLVLSMWVVGYADIFILSRFVDHAELGTYHLASRVAFLVAVLPGGYRKALRPLQKTPMFRAVEDEYGVGNARGIQFGYFTFVLAGTMLMTTVMATVMVRVAPASYASAAPLIPLVAGGLVAPTVYRMINKSVKYADKRVPFIIGAVVAMLAFVGSDAPAGRSDRRQGGADRDDARLRDPDRLRLLPLAARPQPDRPAVAADVHLLRASRSPSASPTAMIDPGGLVLDLIVGHRSRSCSGPSSASPSAPSRRPTAGALLAMVKGLRRRDHGFEAAAGLEALRPRERKSLRRGDRPRAARRGGGEAGAGDAARNGGNGNGGGSDANAVLVEILRRAAKEGGAHGRPDDYARRDDHDRDAQIGAYLFAQGPIAARDQMGKKLINDGVAEPFDLHTLEHVLASLRRADQPTWRGGGD